MTESNDIATVISACSLDARFLPFCLREARTFSKEIVVSAFHRRLDGSPEPDEWHGWLEAMCAPFAARVVWTSNRESEPAKWHHNQARWAGIQTVSSPWLMLLDADEIVESVPFTAWFSEALRAQFHSASFACFWYFRGAAIRSKCIERCGLLVRKAKCTKALMFTENERYSLCREPRYLHQEPKSGLGKPFVHHYSWVHPKAAMLSKVKAWAHKDDKPWVGLVHAEFDRQFNPDVDSDFVHHYRFDRCEPYADVGDFSQADSRE